MMYQICLIFGNAVDEVATFVDAVAVGVKVVAANINVAASAAETITRELLLEALEVVRNAFMILVMLEANSGNM